MKNMFLKMIPAAINRLKPGTYFQSKLGWPRRPQTGPTLSELDGFPGIVSQRTTGVEWINAANVPAGSRQLILYFHGPFPIQTANRTCGLAETLSLSSGVRVLSVASPPVAAGNRDLFQNHCCAVYRWLIENGFSAKDIVIGGDSAAGCLALQTLLSRRDPITPQPAAAFLLASDRELQDLGWMPCPGKVDSAGATFRGGIFSGASKPPPLFIQIHDDQGSLDEWNRLARYAKETALDAALGIWRACRLFAALLPEREQAVRNIGQFVKTVFG